MRRYKGICAMAGYDQQFIVQGIHMVFEGTLGARWPAGETQRTTRLVFICRQLRLKDLQPGFVRCLVPSPPSSSRSKAD